MKRGTCIGAALACLVTRAVCADVPLAVYELEGLRVHPLGTFVAHPFVAYSDPIGSLGGVSIDLSDVATAAPETLTGDYLGFAECATNSFDESLLIGFALQGGWGRADLVMESELTPVEPGVADPDFAGFLLTRVMVLGSSVRTNQDGTFDVGLTFVFYGDRVPAPGAGVLALAALATMCLRRRR